MLLTGLIFGFWFGWLDDVLFEQNFRGMFAGKPVPDTFNYFRGTGYLISRLYVQFPSFPWYGFFLLTCVFASTWIFASVSYKSALKIGLNLVGFVLLFSAFYLAFFLENVFLLTFTRISILGMGAGILGTVSLFYQPGKNFLFQIFCFLVFVFSYLMRPELIIFPLFLFLPIFLLIVLRQREHIKKIIFLGLSILFVLAAHQLTEKIFETKDHQYHDKLWQYARPTLDGFKLNPKNVSGNFSSREDSIRYFAAQNWFYQDSLKLGIKYFQENGTNSWINAVTLESVFKNLQSEWKRSDSYGEYHSSWNWSWKIIFLFLASSFFCLPGLRMILQEWKLSSPGFLLTSLPFFFVGVILVCTSFFKMEDRVFTPLSILFLFSVFLVPQFTNSSFTLSNAFKIFIISIFMIVGTFRIPGYLQTKKENESEYENSKELIRWMETQFSEKTILTDYYSRFYFHGKALSQMEFPSHTSFGIVWGQRASHEFSEYREQLNSICPVSRIDSFLVCAKEKGIIFFIPDFNARLIQSYLDILYHQTLYFKQLEVKGPEQDIHFSFLWFPVKYSWFILVDEVPPTRESIDGISNPFK